MKNNDNDKNIDLSKVAAIKNLDAIIDTTEKSKKKLIKKLFKNKKNVEIIEDIAADIDKSKNKIEEDLNQVNKNNSKFKKSKYFYGKLLIILDVLVIISFFVAYGPLSFFRDWLVTTALTTMSHRYYAYVLYSEEKVKQIASENVTIEVGGETDTSKIKITEIEEQSYYESAYEEQVLKKDEGNDLYKLVEIEGDNYKGYMVVLYDPSRISFVMAKNLSNSGQTVEKIVKDNNAVIGINAGGFKRVGSLIKPSGNVITDGKIYYNNGKKGQLIAFNNDNVLTLTNQTAKQAVANGIRDAVEFGPYLIVNGKVSTFKGNGGYGIHPRTAIGQRQDGIVLLVVIDGRQSSSVGISIKELADIFVKYKAYNAANLDGGGSSTLIINNKLINKPRVTNSVGQRYVINAWIVK